MSNDILISVIIPVYNVKNYLERCVRSVLNQSFRSFELLLIDDGSQDGSAELCDEFAKEDDRVIVQHKENEGVSKARNLGLSLAKGEYIAFIDSDDFVEKEYFEILYEGVKRTGADVSCCSCVELRGDSSLASLKKHVLEKKVVSDYNEILKDYCDWKVYGSVVWGKLIKRQLIGDARFTKLRYGEDTLFIMNILQDAAKVCLDPYIGYNYIRWSDSATLKHGKANVERELDTMKLYHELFHISLKYNDTNNISGIVAMYEHIICKTILSMISLKNKEAYRSGNKELVTDAIHEISKYKLGHKAKFIFFFYQHFPGVLWRLFRVKSYLSREK